MVEKKKQARKVESAFVGVQLTPELLIKLDIKASETTLNRSQIIRLALLEYLNND